MKKVALFSLVIGILMSCNNEKTIDKTQDTVNQVDTLTYIYDSVKVYSKNIVKVDTAKAVVKYPVFKSKELNDYIERQVFNYFGEEEKVTGYQNIASSFIKGYDDFYAENKSTSESWFLLINIKVLTQQPTYISLQYTHSDYAGGAHANTNISYLNFNPKTNQPITLDSLIDVNQKSKLISIAEAIFRRDEHLTATEPLTDKYFFDKGKFSLPLSFFVGKEGLVFLYNPYEIKPFAAGITKLTIPFSQLKGIAKSNTILSK